MNVRRLTTILAFAVGLVLLGAAVPACADDVDDDGVDDAIDVCDNTPRGTTVDAEGRPLGDVDQDCDTDLDDFALFRQEFTAPIAPPGVVIDTVPVGNPGNANDTEGDGYGGVAYTYNIGKYEVTAGQYTAFLNAVAATDTYGLYNTNMWSNSYGCKIERAGSSPNYTYSVAPDWPDRPVSFVGWGDAARFANWLHNGQPTGAQDLGTTEDGSYYLNGAINKAALMAVVREPDATWVIPSEDEWYKAAHHYNDGVTGNYFDYSTNSDTIPSNDLIDPDPGNNATYYDGVWPDSAGFTTPYYRTEVGAHENSNSPYDTFDQDGNVSEWNEAAVAAVGSYRGLRGGSFYYYYGFLHAGNRYFAYPNHAYYFIGFRVAEVP